MSKKLLKPLTVLEQKVLAWLIQNCRPEPGIVAFPSVRKQAASMEKAFQVIHEYRHNLADKGWLTFHPRTGAVTSVVAGIPSAMPCITPSAFHTEPMVIKITSEEAYRP